MKGPYFEGQQPSSCGHYYPDTCRIQDFRVEGKPIRMNYCRACGFSLESIDESELDLANPGFDKSDLYLVEVGLWAHIEKMRMVKLKKAKRGRKKS